MGKKAKGAGRRTGGKSRANETDRGASATNGSSGAAAQSDSSSPEPPTGETSSDGQKKRKKRKRKRGLLRSMVARVGKEMGLVSKTKADERTQKDLTEAVVYGDDGEESVDYVRL